MKYPLFNLAPNIPVPGSPGSFGFQRSHYFHDGNDLYCQEGQEVIAIEDGVVVDISIFTGEDADPPSPWWNSTKAVLVEGKSGVIGYCEINPMFYLVLGFKVKEGDMIGRVVPVLKEDKGNGTSMLHLNLYTPGTTKHVTWALDQEKPENLLDSTQLLRSIK
jgi:hypothetical protein